MSARWTITDEFGHVRLGSENLPGVMIRLEVSQDVEINEEEVPGRSGKTKQAKGFSDATVTIDIRLLSDDDETCYDKLEKVQAMFRSTDASAVPEVLRVVNVHTEKRGIDKVLFKSLRSSEGTYDDTIDVTVELVEYIPVIPARKEDQGKRPESRGNAGDEALRWFFGSGQ